METYPILCHNGEIFQQVRWNPWVETHGYYRRSRYATSDLPAEGFAEQIPTLRGWSPHSLTSI